MFHHSEVCMYVQLVKDEYQSAPQTDLTVLTGWENSLRNKRSVGFRKHYWSLGCQWDWLNKPCRADCQHQPRLFNHCPFLVKYLAKVQTSLNESAISSRCILVTAPPTSVYTALSESLTG